MGAEEWGVATGSLIVMGCIMLRKCHLNTCSVGIATQDPELRKLFKGTPESVINYFMFLAGGLREHMARLGFRTVNDMIGRVDKLRVRDNITHWKAKTLNLSPILYKAKVMDRDHSFCCVPQDHKLSESIDNKLIAICEAAINKNETVSSTLEINWIPALLTNTSTATF